MADGKCRDGRLGGGRGSNVNHPRCDERGRRSGGNRGRGRGRYQGRVSGSEGTGGKGIVGYRLPQLPANPSNLQFIRAVLKSCPNHKLAMTIEQMDKAWVSCWQCVDTLPLDALKILLSALSRLPFSASTAPPPLSAISIAVGVLLSHHTQYGLHEVALDGNDGTLEGVELAERVVARLLKFTWNLKKDDVKNALDEMIANADANLSIRLTTHRPVRNRLATLLGEIEKPWTIKVRNWEVTQTRQRVLIPDWRHPTVAWLADYKNFQPILLPKLQPSGTNNGRVFESTDEYFLTILQLWIGMTFVEGNNALLPHCTVRAGDKMCDQPLWPFPGKHESIKCKNSQCSGSATFLCAHKQHAKGICNMCASEYQRRLSGPPSKHASTHVYDGFIAQVKYDGTMSIEQVASRRPPLTTIHWKTTKRLSSSNLIGIVRLGNRAASLRATDDIYWAEVIFQGNSFDEYKVRERGCLTLRMLQYLENSGNAIMSHNPAVGDAVAIIDCQTFVPEFIPVLIALEKQRQMPVPFQNGALLNLCGHTKLEQNSDLDTANNGDDNDDDIDASNSESEVAVHNLVRKVIDLSLLDPIVDIRRDAVQRSRLESSLEVLVKGATLDPGQLKSFAEALINPVHCTQGPPGTGKSYLGVVVVRALLIIRDIWKAKNCEIGDPPILVLSYKNHAIDEFLLDLLRSEPTLNNTTFGYRNKQLKKLVRIGGRSSEPMLEPYREHNLAFSDPDVHHVKQRLDECQGLRDQWHQLRDCFAPIYEAHQAVADGLESLCQDRRIIIQRAVPAISSAVATLLKISENLKEDNKENVLAVEDAIENLDEENESSTSGIIDFDTSLDSLNYILKSKPVLANVDIAGLYGGIKHYDSAIDPMEVLYQWLSGFCPLPACAYGESCSIVSSDKSLYCREHSCMFTKNDEQFCLSRVVHKRSFCLQHLCSADMCESSRINESQLFCHDHACFVCLAKDKVADFAVGEPPRNTCDCHPLCWRLDSMCAEVAEPGTSYCKMHAEDLYCKQVACGETAITGQYCSRHYADAIALAQASSEKCEARTRKGRPCKGKPLAGSKFCRDHVALGITFAAPPKAIFYAEKPAEQYADLAKTLMVPSPNDRHIEPSKLMRADEVAEDEKIDESNSSDNDETEFEDAIEFANEDEVEESEHLQHLRDVYEIGNDTVVGIDLVDKAVEEAVPWVCSNQLVTKPHLWHWNMIVEERWNALFSVLGLWSNISTRLQLEFSKEFERLKFELEREILRASSRVYEGKAIIAGTITGCVSRLEAIRTTNPFAILVEEASEVMEPLLVSCFSSSTRKLEMIGDHFQLQPSVMGRIDFERINKINVSLFERLIKAPHGYRVPSSVLSIQRRMRKSICDLTRNFYDEITSIEDHPVCGTKVLGGVKRKSGTVPLLDLCEGAGREVPGVSPHIFFWTHSGRQERSDIGISRVNKQEAKMTCKLVQYLVHCGVPASSIAVLTPYKGQLKLMQKMLVSIYDPKMITRGRDTRLIPSCFLSTVDRFQGDEADIVIISLVIDGKSRTSFVKLQNRIIVLLSRARLALYVMGNIEYLVRRCTGRKRLVFLKKKPSLITQSTIVQHIKGAKLVRRFQSAALHIDHPWQWLTMSVT
ncbi:putative P-loop containing nucleoside triphosphate hydrolase, DNA2/NAM7 helicase, AAA [Plasmopara halstedii]